tara:strand:- start:613 stop:828 length:216 start_codon:yes stop_codon:yes gene_type:complete
MNNKLTATIQIKTTKEDKKTLEEIAKRHRVSLSAYIRQLALKDIIENESKVVDTWRNYIKHYSSILKKNKK